MVLGRSGGGGTLDISAAECFEGVCSIVFSVGNRSFGSVDYDHAICKYIVTWLEQEHNLPTILSDSALYANILYQSEQVKISLGTRDSAIINIEVPNQVGDIEVYTREITRQLYTEITSTLSGKLTTLLDHVKVLLKENGLDSEIIPIYLTGQGSKLFLIRKFIQDVFPDAPIIDKYQESAVCQGLTLQGGKLSGVYNELIKKILLIDIFCSYIDILCQCYDQETGIIYIGTNNHTFHRLIEPFHYVPFKKSCIVSFIEDAKKNKCEITLFDFNPSDNSRTKILSVRVPAQTTLNELSILQVDIDAGGELSAAIYTYEYEK